MSNSSFDWDNVHQFVDEKVSRGYNVRWDGWDVVFWQKNPRGMTHPRGSWRGQWGIETRVSPDNNGQWVIPKRYVHS